MSSISSIGAGSGLGQLLQNISTKGSDASKDSSPLAPAHKHKKTGGLGGFDKLAAAITNALQSASSSSGGTPADANQTITAALTKIFKNGSVDSTGEPDTDSDGASGTSTNAATSFEATLKSFGVTPQQFRTDLAAALKSAEQTGNADASTAFKSFPAGSIVDTIG